MSIPRDGRFLCKRILARIDRDLITMYPAWGSGYVKDHKLIAKYDEKYFVLNMIEMIKEQNNLDQVFIDCVKWDIVNAIMESSFSIKENEVSFFKELLKLYESGNYPCGAQVKGNGVTLLIY